MKTILFPDFYTDSSVFQAAELYWKTLVEELATKHGQKDDWVSWRNHTYADGTPYARDGGNVTMLDLCNHRIGRAINIQQWPSSPEDGSEPSMSAWTGRTHTFLDDDIVTIEELTLNIEMTQDAVSVARDLIDLWMEPDVEVATLEEVIRSRIPSSD
jgi:hypothetical protein